MIREHYVAFGALAVHLEDAAPAAGAHEAPHAALVHDLQRLHQVGVVEEVERRQVLVAHAAAGADGLKQLGAQTLHSDALHRAGREQARAGAGAPHRLPQRRRARWAALAAPWGSVRSALAWLELRGV